MTSSMPLTTATARRRSRTRVGSRKVAEQPRGKRRKAMEVEVEDVEPDQPRSMRRAARRRRGGRSARDTKKLMKKLMKLESRSVTMSQSFADALGVGDVGDLDPHHFEQRHRDRQQAVAEGEDAGELDALAVVAAPAVVRHQIPRSRMTPGFRLPSQVNPIAGRSWGSREYRRGCPREPCPRSSCPARSRPPRWVRRSTGT